MRHLVAIASLAIAPALSHAQAFKCKVDGKVVYQGSPCAAEGSKVNLLGAGETVENSPATSYLKREGARIDFEEKVDVAIRNNKVFVGMSAAHVIRSWGEPTSVNKTITGSSLSEQWVYRRGNIADTQYLYMKNGVLEAMQSPKTP